jgi:response regulator RpfG family c-di-GMP phosphodiesterase
MAGLTFRVDIFAGFFQNRQRINGKLSELERQNPGRKSTAKHKPTPVLLLVGNGRTRDYLSNLLSENNYSPLLMTDAEELLRSLQGKEAAIILIDCSAVSSFGTRMLSKIKVSSRLCRIIIFCDKEHFCDKRHRELIKEILAIGVYACILAPYKEWEVLSMVSYGH